MVIYNCPKGQGHKQIPKIGQEPTEREEKKNDDEHKHKDKKRSWERF